jgi:hypothetical protein
MGLVTHVPAFQHCRISVGKYIISEGKSQGNGIIVYKAERQTFRKEFGWESI